MADTGTTDTGTTDTVTIASTAPYKLAVIMERVRVNDRWGSERWEVKGVVRDMASGESAGRVIVENDTVLQMLYPGLELRLHPDEAEGYLYNLTSPHPKVFVLWRLNDGMARPERVTVSYHEGARWMDAEDGVHGVALPQDLLPWIDDFARLHYRPEGPKKKRYASSKDKGVASHRDGPS